MGKYLKNIADYFIVFDLLMNPCFLQKNYKTWYCMPPISVDAASDDSKKQKAALGALLRRKIPRIDASQ